jgi:hypothetical protein
MTIKSFINLLNLGKAFYYLKYTASNTFKTCKIMPMLVNHDVVSDCSRKIKVDEKTILKKKNQTYKYPKESKRRRHDP